jgi:hypothetical protein
LLGSQLSSVQTLPSSQLSAGPLTHFPFEQLSPFVQAFPSLQVVPAAGCWQPAFPSHLPVLPHGRFAGQVVLSRGDAFAGMLLHVPTFDCTTQL